MPEPYTGDGISEQVFQARRTSFGAEAATYDRVRPEWPAQTVSWLIGELGQPSDVVDLGAGTGKGTRTLAALGHRVTAVEPSAQMLQVLQLESTPAGPGSVTTVQAGAERLPLADDSADAIACFQAWHWTDPSLAGPECARVLRPDGVLGLGWHALDAGVDWVAELNRITLRPESTAIAEQQDDPEPIPGFGPGERERFTYLMALSPANLAVQAGTWSAVAVHPERERILGQVEDLGAKVAGPDGLVRLPHVTIAVRYRPA